MIQRLSGLLCDDTSLFEYVADILICRGRSEILYAQEDGERGKWITMKLEDKVFRVTTSNRRPNDLGIFTC